MEVGDTHDVGEASSSQREDDDDEFSVLPLSFKGTMVVYHTGMP